MSQYACGSVVYRCSRGGRIVLTASTFAVSLVFAWTQSCNPPTASARFAWDKTDATAYNDLAAKAAVDSQRNVYIVGTDVKDGESDIVVTKYDKAGTQQWRAAFNGNSSNPGVDKGYGIAVDGLGAVYVCGAATRSSGIGLDYVVVKYPYNYQSGNPAWVRYFDGGHGDDEARAIALDSQQNVYVTGRSLASNDKFDVITLRLNGNDGEFSNTWAELNENNPVGTRRYNNNASGHDEGLSITVDADGDPILTGRAQISVSPSNYDVLTVKYVGDGGSVDFAEVFDASSSTTDSAGVSVTTDPSKNVYVAGRFAGQNSTGALIKYLPDGTLCWYDDPYIGKSELEQVVYDSNGFVVAAGYCVPQGEDKEAYFVAKYHRNFRATGVDPENERSIADPPQLIALPIWENAYDGGGDGDAKDFARSLAVDSHGYIFVTGESDGNEGEEDFWTLSLRPNDGAICWQARYKGNLTGDDIEKGVWMAMDSGGNLAIVGTATGAETGTDIAVIRYCRLPGDVNSDGVVDDTDLAIVLECFGNSADACSTLDLDRSGTVDDPDLAIVLENFGKYCGTDW
ncbi:MAG: SBBP repeat-containing protein [Armatimonadetes bacterium]|nr:SBBP repeat-containing protein [Armatimonadota bacterium]